MTSRTGSARMIWGISKKSVSRVENWTPNEKTVGFRLLAEARPVALWGVPHVLGGGCRWKSHHKRLCISLPCVKTFNSKVIKGFVPELRSRYVFFVFWDSYVLCIYVTNILCTFRISVSGLGTLCHLMKYGVAAYVLDNDIIVNEFELHP